MPDDNNTQQNNNSNNNTQQNNSSNNNTQGNNPNGGSGKKYAVGMDTNQESDKKNLDEFCQALEACGNTVQQTQIGPNQESYLPELAKQMGADTCIFLCAVAPITVWSFTNAVKAGTLPHTIFGGEGWLHDPNDPEGALADLQHMRDYDLFDEWDSGQFCGDSCRAQLQADAQSVNAKTLGEWVDAHSEYVSLCYGSTPTELAQNICNGNCQGGGSAPSNVVNSGGGAQIKDKTFEKCIKRICAATDSIFLVENNAAILFPYTDWMAFTLRQKINRIKSNEIDPNVFGIEYNNDNFYNKVSIAWGGDKLPERFPSEQDNKEQLFKDKIANYTAEDILKNMVLTQFQYKKNFNNITPTTTTQNKNRTTQTISSNSNGVSILSEQYDALVQKYGVIEKRVQSSAPDLETAQYIVNALLIQYVRDFNNTCRCRALNVRKYIGGSFYAVENPFNKSSEMYYLNSYTIRTQKDAPMYHDLEFKYGPEGAEELLDYQTLSGGGASGANGQSSIGGGSATEEQIWKDAAKCKWAQDQEDCSTNDPATAKKHYDTYTKQGKEVHFDCFGMSAYLYYRFNYEAKIPCQVVGDSGHKVVMLDRGNGFVSTQEEYRKYNLDYLFKWRDNQNTTVLLRPPNNLGSTSGGNTNKKNTNSGNGDK